MASPVTLLFCLQPAFVNTSESSSFSSFPASSSVSSSLSGGWQISSKEKQNQIALPSLRCNAISKPQFQDLFKNAMPQIKWQNIIEKDDTQVEALEFTELNKVRQCVDLVKAMLGSMGDGEISISAYDTAWVALVQDINGSGAPQFPSSLLWIIENQLNDGSWGDEYIFSAHDRIINTLACVIALKSWNIHAEMCDNGMSFIRKNMCKLKDENNEHMPIGFEVTFPSLLEIARSLNIIVPEDSPVLQDIYAQRDIKASRIPKDMMHIVPTTLLHSLEGMPGLDWEKLLKLQCLDGSFLFSPSSTAFALMQTKDKNCLKYINKVVARFSGGVPNVYPVDLFEHVWSIDRLERLGVSRYFQAEIEECIDYVHRYWTEKGISWARNSTVYDIDDTAMGFRLLRLHGRAVSADTFQHFKKDGEFFCFVGQSNQAVTGMYNLHRASQVSFPGETILEEANKFSYKFLREKQASKQLIDKWIIAKDLPGEVEYALDVPWYASLPRIETRFFIDQYGGQDDVWIGKTLYRMPYVNNNVYLELAKMDFKNCQVVHQLEWVNIQKWYTESNLGNFGIGRRSLLMAYFLATSNIFEPERATQRLAWTKTALLAQAISLYIEHSNSEELIALAQELLNTNTTGPNDILNKFWWSSNGSRPSSKEGTVGTRLIQLLHETIDGISLDVLVVKDRDVRHHLLNTWETWLMSWKQQADLHQQGDDAELIVRTLTLCAGHFHFQDVLSHRQYPNLVNLTNRVCHKLEKSKFMKREINGASANITTIPSIESDMQELVQCVLQSSNKIDTEIKKIFLTVVKSFFYVAHCTPATINRHIDKVLFEEVV